MKQEIICPITGSTLIYSHIDEYVRDSSSFYYAESDPSIKYARHPFSWNMFALVNSFSMMERSSRYFKLHEDGTWSEYIKVKELDTLFPIGTPQKEIDEAIKIALEARAKKLAEYEAKVASGEVYDSRIKAKLLQQEITVKPMQPPSNIIYYIDIQ